MSFIMIMLYQNMMKKQNCVVWIQIISLHYIKTDDIYRDFPEDIEAGFDTSNY